jgi:hypothetical protein
MRLRATMEPKAPAWRWSCDSKVTAVTHVGVPLAGCTLEVAAPPAGTAVLVDPSTTLGGLACGTKPGNVERFDILPEGLPSVLGIACDAAAKPTCPGPTCYESLEGGKLYRFRVIGHGAGADAQTWAASCSALAKEGLTVPAVCDPLSASGAVAIEIAPLLALKPTTKCEPGAMPGAMDTIVSYQACDPSCDAPNVSTPVLSCTEDVLLQPLSAGKHTIEVIGRGDSVTTDDGGVVPGEVWLNATCSADVVPGETVAPVCVAK